MPRVIVVDDGSEPPISTCLESLSSLGWLEVVRLEENKGLWNARNCGVEVCETPYVTFVDADDLVEQNFLDSLLIPMRQHHHAIAPRYRDWYPDSASLRLDPRSFPPMKYQAFVIALECFMPSFSTVLRAAFLEVGGYRPHVTEDWDFWIRFFRLGFTAVQISECSYTYRIRPNSLSRQPNMVFRDLLTIRTAWSERSSGIGGLLLLLPWGHRKLVSHVTRVEPTTRARSSRIIGHFADTLFHLILRIFRLYYK